MNKAQHTVKRAALWALAVGVVIAGCNGQEPPPGGTIIVPDQGGPPIDDSIFPPIGSTSFMTANENELLSYGTHDYYDNGRNSYDELADDAEGGAEEPSDPSPEPMPEPDPSREIVEADLFYVEGDLVYVLNRYRGLVIIDLEEPDHPAVLGRLPFQAVPVEMYVREGRAYIVMSDYFEYWMFDRDADPLGFHGSQILIVDVSDPTSPHELGGQQVDGEITDTRMVGDVIYTVSKRNANYWRYNTADWEDTTWVASLNIRDPGHIREVDRITFQGTSTLIHVAPHAIFVAATDPNFYLYDPGHEQETLVTYVDISDAGGDIEQRGHFYVPGSIGDKFKMDYYDHTFRVFTQGWWSSDGGETVFLVDVSYPDEMEIVGELSLDSDDYGWMQATRFSEGRAYAMTQRWDDRTVYEELHVLELSDPAAPVLASTIRINGNVSHFEVRESNTRLLALGRSYGDRIDRIQLTLFDVADAAEPRELSRVPLGERYSYSAADSDYKALRVLDSMNLILLPLTYWDRDLSRSFNGTQLVDWIDDTLTERGRVTNIDTVQRAFPVGERIVAMSTMQVQVIDASDRDNPVETAALDLIRNVYDLYDIGGYEVQLVGDLYEGGVSFQVLPFGPDDDAATLAELELPYSGAPVSLREGDLLHMIGWEADRGQVIHTADFTDPLHPRLRGDLLLTDELERIYSYGYSYYYRYWSPDAGLALENRLLPVTVRRIIEDGSGRRDFESELRLIDMSDPDDPRVAETSIPMNDFPFINKVTHGEVLYSTHVEQALSPEDVPLLYHVRSYLDRIDVSDVDHPVVLPSVNIPGWLVDVSDDGEVLYTIDYQWDQFGRRRNSLNTLRLEGDEAVLVEVIPVSDQVNRAVFRDRTVWLTTHKYPWWGVHSDTADSRQPYTVMNRVQIGDGGAVASFTSARIPGYHFDLLDVDEDLAYLASSYPYGMLVLDVDDPADPTIVSSARTVGYISQIVLHEDYIYSPLGMFGVHRMSRHP
jgi:hypothetical protein